MQTPHIKTPLPGPKAQAMLARDAQVISPSYPRDYPFVMSHGRGAEVWDVDGNRYIDFHAGYGANVVGHANPAVVRAVQHRVTKGTHFAQPSPRAAGSWD